MKQTEIGSFHCLFYFPPADQSHKNIFKDKILGLPELYDL